MPTTPQGRIHARLALFGRQLENAQVCLVRAQWKRMRAVQHIMGHPESVRGEQVLPISIVRKHPGHLHQRVDHMAIFDPVLGLAAQSRHPGHASLTKPDLDHLS